MAEIDKFIEFLVDHGYTFMHKPCCGGRQVIVYDRGVEMFDVVCHPYSYGGTEGLLEVMDRTFANCILSKDESKVDDVLGRLTAEDIIKRLEKTGIHHVYK